MTKAIIQIPCFNEQATLGRTIEDLPARIPGIDKLELLIVDDGSSDGTVAVAQAYGVTHIIRLENHQGLSSAFSKAMESSLRAGADVIINTDADNQYCGADVHALVKPILDGEADMVVGIRPIKTISDFSPLKRFLQLTGSRFIQLISGIRIRDAASGFRAFSAEAAARLKIRSRFTYTLESLVVAGAEGLRVANVPVRVNPETRPSRLSRSTANYMRRATATIGRILLTQKPYRLFSVPGVVFLVFGLLAVVLTLVWPLDFAGTNIPSAPFVLITAGIVLNLAAVFSVAVIKRLKQLLM